MPFYEYQCGECDHRLEVLQKISDAPLLYCPQCSAPSLRKLISAAAFRLKGTGWYATDFKNNDQKKQEPKSKDSGAENAGAEAPNADSNKKPAAGAGDSGSLRNASDSAGASVSA